MDYLKLDEQLCFPLYVCSICGYVYDPEVGDPENGIPAGTRFEDLPEDWHCPRCKQGKDKFNRA